MSHNELPLMLRVHLLGGFRIALAEQVLPVDALRLRAAQQVIKLLALAPGYQLHREQVLATLWPDQEPRAAVNSLNQTLYVARRALAPATSGLPWLVLRDQKLRLGEPHAVWVDAVAFAEAAERARRQHSLREALDALALYAGDLLLDDPYDSWLDARRAALRQLYRSLLLDAAGWAEGTIAAEPVRAALQQALASDPADEELQRVAMRLAARAGDRPAALRQYALLERALRHDLQLEPDELTKALYADIVTLTVCASFRWQRWRMPTCWSRRSSAPLACARLRASCCAISCSCSSPRAACCWCWTIASI